MTATPPIADDELLDLVRAADPLDPDATPLDADALLREILATSRTERRVTGHGHRTAVIRVAAVSAAVAAASAAAFALSSGGRGTVTPASAAVIRRALAALDQPAGTILHVDMIGTQHNGDGTTITWRDQSWQENDPPYDRRQVETTPDGTTTESGNVGENEQVYDPATNTIYMSTTTDASSTKRVAQRRFWISPGPRPGTYLVRLAVYGISASGKVGKVMPGRGPRETLVVPAAQARALREGTDAIIWKRRPRGMHPRFAATVVPASQAPEPPTATRAEPDSPAFAGEINDLLRSGRARLVGHATIDGRDTLEIRSRDGHTTYYVDPTTYAPVELDTTGTDGGTSLRFTVYELLPANDGNHVLLSLTAQHPSATLDQNQADYVAAEKRIFPHG